MKKLAAELLAHAVRDLFPGVILIEGGASHVGFWYEFVLDKPIDENLLMIIEENMWMLAREALPVKTLEMMRENAADYFKYHKQPIQATKVSDKKDNIVQILSIGDFRDLCEGDYGESTKEAGVFKLLEIKKVGTYGTKKQQIIRLEGVTYVDAKALRKFLKLRESAKKSEHRVLGEELDLYSFAGDQVLWHPKGAILRELLLDWWRNEHKEYQPLYQQDKAFKESGKFAGLIYKMKNRQEREMPLRYREIRACQFTGKAAELSGLLCAEGYVADMTYLFCSSSQLYKELIAALHFFRKMTHFFALEPHWYLVTCDQKGKQFAPLMRQALEECGIKYLEEDERNASRELRIEIRYHDLFEREWSGPCIAFDFQLSKQLNLEFSTREGDRNIPIVLKRSTFGSIERMIALMVERYQGRFPLWLAPEQVRIVPVDQASLDYACQIQQRLICKGLRTGIDYSGGSLKAMIHLAESQRVPYIAVVGDKEVRSGSLAVRNSRYEQVQQGVRVEDFLTQLQNELLQKE